LQLVWLLRPNLVEFLAASTANCLQPYFRFHTAGLSGSAPSKYQIAPDATFETCVTLYAVSDEFAGTPIGSKFSWF
jgi:hypothetical protein